MKNNGLFKFILVILALFLFSKVFAGEEQDHMCLKCNGTGKVRDEFGYFAYVDCPRCYGEGYLTY